MMRLRPTRSHASRSVKLDVIGGTKFSHQAIKTFWSGWAAGAVKRGTVVPPSRAPLASPLPAGTRLHVANPGWPPCRKTAAPSSWSWNRAEGVKAPAPAIADRFSGAPRGGTGACRPTAPTLPPSAPGAPVRSCPTPSGRSEPCRPPVLTRASGKFRFANSSTSCLLGSGNTPTPAPLLCLVLACAPTTSP